MTTFSLVDSTVDGSFANDANPGDKQVGGNALNHIRPVGRSLWTISQLPRYADYPVITITLATTSFAFSPTGTLPLTRTAKILMMAQAAISIVDRHRRSGDQYPGEKLPFNNYSRNRFS